MSPPGRRDLEPIAVWPPRAGHYAMRLVAKGPRVPVRIWYGAAVINGEEQDRSHDWRVEIDGRTDRWELDEAAGYRCRVALEVDRAWPFCAREPITEAHYRYLVAHSLWAREHSPGHPKARPRQAVDFNTLPMRF